MRLIPPSQGLFAKAKTETLPSQQAAKAYDARAMALFGSFASLNFPYDDRQPPLPDA